MDSRVLWIEDTNIERLRKRFPNGLHFVVGDTHGEYTTLMNLMEKICFDSKKDHVYFVGDYNAGGDVRILLHYLGNYYQVDCAIPGFHLIRGNHERELYPEYELADLPDIYVLKSKIMTYYISHAGMVNSAFNLIQSDIETKPDQKLFAYALNDEIACMDAPLRQIIWSRRGLYSQRSHYHVWPSEEVLRKTHSCVIHGHTPFSMLKKGNYFDYGDRNLFWLNQRIWFSEDLQSFDVDSNVKGRYDSKDLYRGLSCICLEVLDEIAEANSGVLTCEGIRSAENFAFAVPYEPNVFSAVEGDIERILKARPVMKRIGLDDRRRLSILE